MKSYVAVDEKICPVCGCKHEYGILLRNDLKPTFESAGVVTGYDVCPDCNEKLDDGYIALVEASNESPADRIKQQEVERTGKIVWVKREVFGEIFNCEPEPVMFASLEVVRFLEELSEHSD